MADRRMPADFRADAAKLDAWAAAPADSADDVARNLTGLYRTLHALNISNYDVDALAKAAPALVHSLFASRMRLKDRVREWEQKGLLDAPVQRALRDAFRVMRYGADMLGELAIGHRRLPEDGKTLRAYRGINSNTLINPSFDIGRDLEFKSGDIIIMRGRAANSAAIARIGDVDSQYSHAGLVHVDPAGRAWMVEVLIEKGGVIVPLADALAHDLGRAIVLRHPDEALAHRAATIAYDRLSKAVSVKPILYDFTMELDGYKRLYCSKLVRMAYLEASGGAVRLPSYPTSLDMTNRDFFDRIGVTARRTFAPGDLEIEPSLETVAEWQDYRVTAELRLADLVMDKLFEWMETDGLRFEEDFLVRLISRLGRFAAGLSGGVKSMIDEVVPTAPPHMPRRTIAAIIMLHKTAQPLVQELLETEAERSRVFGYGLHPTEVLEFLERKRERLAGRIGYLTGLARRS